MSQQPDLRTTDATDHDQYHDQDHQLMNRDEDSLVDPRSMNQEEARYVLEVTKLMLSIARNLQQTEKVHQLDCLKFVASYKDKYNWTSRMIVNGMLGDYIAIYENLANRMSHKLLYSQ